MKTTIDNSDIPKMIYFKFVYVYGSDSKKLVRLRIVQILAPNMHLNFHS